MAKQSKTTVKKSAPKNAAAKKAAPKNAAASKAVSSKGKLHGQTVCFVGKFGYSNSDQHEFESFVRSHGGKVVDSNAKQIDNLFVGEGRGGKLPGDVAKIQKAFPAVNVLLQKDFVQLLLPDRAEILREIAKGKRKDQDRYWEHLSSLCWKGKQTLDLTKTNLQKSNFSGAYLRCIDLTGSDLREVVADYTTFGNLEKINFQGCSAPHAYFSHLLNCDFRKAQLEHVWLFFTQNQQPVAPQRAMNHAEYCDFSNAQMLHGRADRGKFVACQFKGTNLSDAVLEKTEFQRCDFSNADLTRINAKETKFSEAVFKDANLSNADFRNSSFVEADLRNASLTGAILSDTDFSGAKIAGADFQGAILDGAKFDKADLTKAKNLVIPETRQAGHKLLELTKAIAGSSSFLTTARSISTKTNSPSCNSCFGAANRLPGRIIIANEMSSTISNTSVRLSKAC